jgi:hypothetical protein
MTKKGGIVGSGLMLPGDIGQVMVAWEGAIFIHDQQGSLTPQVEQLQLLQLPEQEQQFPQGPMFV